VIPRFTDHAANERTFLAWVRTGIATIAFGFVIEKFRLFAAMPETPYRTRSGGRLSTWLGQHDGSVLIFIGLVLIMVAAVRFIRIGRLIEDSEAHTGQLFQSNR